MPGGDRTVYVQTNEPENTVVAFRRGAGGALDRLGSYGSGGADEGTPPAAAGIAVT